MEGLRLLWVDCCAAGVRRWIQGCAWGGGEGHSPHAARASLTHLPPVRHDTADGADHAPPAPRRQRPRRQHPPTQALRGGHPCPRPQVGCGGPAAPPRHRGRHRAPDDRQGASRGGPSLKGAAQKPHGARRPRSPNTGAAPAMRRGPRRAGEQDPPAHGGRRVPGGHAPRMRAGTASRQSAQGGRQTQTTVQRRGGGAGAAPGPAGARVQQPRVQAAPLGKQPPAADGHAHQRAGASSPHPQPHPGDVRQGPGARRGGQHKRLARAVVVGVGVVGAGAVAGAVATTPGPYATRAVVIAAAVVARGAVLLKLVTVVVIAAVSGTIPRRRRGGRSSAPVDKTRAAKRAQVSAGRKPTPAAALRPPPLRAARAGPRPTAITRGGGADTARAAARAGTGTGTRPPRAGPRGRPRAPRGHGVVGRVQRRLEAQHRAGAVGSPPGPRRPRRQGNAGDAALARRGHAAHPRGGGHGGAPSKQRTAQEAAARQTRGCSGAAPRAQSAHGSRREGGDPQGRSSLGAGVQLAPAACTSHQRCGTTRGAGGRVP
jgi:hypothetical protein